MSDNENIENKQSIAPNINDYIDKENVKTNDKDDKVINYPNTNGFKDFRGWINKYTSRWKARSDTLNDRCPHCNAKITMDIITCPSCQKKVR